MEKINGERAQIQRLFKNLAQRNITGYYVPSLREARAKIMELLPDFCTVGIGNSKTLKDMKITAVLLEKGYTVLDKTLADSKEDAVTLKKQALLTDWYICGCNAISMDGHLVNMDHSGNRVAAMVFGPDKVIIVAGINKVVSDLEDAIRRVRNHAAPFNAIRAGMNPPCVQTGKCVDCRHPERVCCNLLITEGQADPHRMTVIIVGEERGF